MGDGAFGDGLAEFWHFHVGCVTGAAVGGVSLRLFLSFFCFFLALVSGGVVGCGACLILVTDDGDDLANLDGVILVSLNFNNGAGYGGGDFGIDLVGGDLEQWFVYLDGIADGLEPLRDGAFGYGFAQLGHLNGVRHEL